MNELEVFLNKLKIKKGDKILVSSDILRLLVQSRKKKFNFNPNELINLLKDKVGKNGNVFIPTFNWDFFKGKVFNPLKTVSQSGSLGNVALKRKDFSRTFNPIYSFVVTGKDKDKICRQRHDNCFSLNSPFGYLIKNKGKNLIIDLHNKDMKEKKFVGFVFHHVVEQAVGVSYRYIKEINGFYKKANNKKKLVVKFYARDLKKNYRIYLSKKLYNDLYKRKILKRKNFNGINFDLLDINPTFKLLKKDLKSKRKYFMEYSTL